MKLINMFNSIEKKFDIIERSSLIKRKEELMNNSLFSKWWNNCLNKYRGAITGTKFDV